MKDEEMAEERTKEYIKDHAEKYNCEETKLETANYNVGLKTGYGDGFLEGLKAGRPQWHKVTDDLPNNQRYVWTNKGAGYHDDDGWWDSFGRLYGVFAWCEPEFEVEK